MSGRRCKFQDTNESRQYSRKRGVVFAAKGLDISCSSLVAAAKRVSERQSANAGPGGKEQWLWRELRAASNDLILALKRGVRLTWPTPSSHGGVGGPAARLAAASLSSSQPLRMGASAIHTSFLVRTTPIKSPRCYHLLQKHVPPRD